jgi:hypothetical protein
MPIRALALLVAVLPAPAAAQEMLVLAAVVTAPPTPATLAAPPPAPHVVPGGAIRLAVAQGAPPGLHLGF